MIKKNFLIFSVVIILISTRVALANYDNYYSKWTNNLFDVIEINYSWWFSPHQETYKESIPSTGGTLYYREYNNNNKLVVHIDTVNFKHEVYFVLSDQWYYWGELDEVDSMLCQGGCNTPYNNNDFYDDNDWVDNLSDNYWDINVDDFYWDNPDEGDSFCHSPCSWNHSTHMCECFGLAQ